MGERGRRLPAKLIDKLERAFIERGRSVSALARAHKLPEARIRRLLMSAGLEVDGRVKPGLLTQAEADQMTVSFEEFDSTEACIADFLKRRHRRREKVRQRAA